MQNSHLNFLKHSKISKIEDVQIGKITYFKLSENSGHFSNLNHAIIRASVIFKLFITFV